METTKDSMTKAGNLLIMAILSNKSAVEIIDKQNEDIDKLLSKFVLTETAK